MPVFRLEPIPEQAAHPDWEATTHKGPCHVGAKDESWARRYATNTFAIATTEPKASPWGQGDLVSCTEVAELGEPMPDGMVTVPVREDG